METSKIEEFLRKNKENQRNVGVAGRHGISGGFGVEPCSLWGFGVERAGWFGNVGCAAVGFAAGPPTLGRPCPPTWRGSDICALCLSQQQEIETPNLHVESAIFYQILGYSSAAVHLNEVNNGSMLRPGVG